MASFNCYLLMCINLTLQLKYEPLWGLVLFLVTSVFALYVSSKQKALYTEALEGRMNKSRR